MQITYTLSRAEEAALREDVRRKHPAPSESAVGPALEAAIAAYLYRLRDEHRTDAVTSAAFIRRFTTDEMAAIEAAASVSEQLGAWLVRVETEQFVWLGSNEAQIGKAALVAAGLLTQERADVIFAYSLPELPA
jgi:hypothetical protein